MNLWTGNRVYKWCKDHKAMFFFIYVLVGICLFLAAHFATGVEYKHMGWWLAMFAGSTYASIGVQAIGSWMSE